MRKTERKQRFAHLLVCFYCHFTHKRWKLRTGSNLPCMYQSQEEITPSATKTLGFYLVSVLDLKKRGAQDQAHCHCNSQRGESKNSPYEQPPL